jgi:hypothetical protein
MRTRPQPSPRCPPPTPPPGASASDFDFFPTVPSSIAPNCTSGDCALPTALSAANQTSYSDLGNLAGAGLLTVATKDLYPAEPRFYFSPGAWCGRRSLCRPVDGAPRRGPLRVAPWSRSRAQAPRERSLSRSADTPDPLNIPRRCDTAGVNVTLDDIAAVLPQASRRRRSRRLAFQPPRLSARHLMQAAPNATGAPGGDGTFAGTQVNVTSACRLAQVTYRVGDGGSVRAAAPLAGGLYSVGLGTNLADVRGQGGGRMAMGLAACHDTLGLCSRARAPCGADTRTAPRMPLPSCQIHTPNFPIHTLPWPATTLPPPHPITPLPQGLTCVEVYASYATSADVFATQPPYVGLGVAQLDPFTQVSKRVCM